MTTQSPESEAQGGYPIYVLFMLGFVYALNFLDRQLLSIVAEPVRLELGLNDTQLGLLTGLAFALVYTLLGVPVAMLADRTNRVRIVSAACAIWSCFTVLSGMAGSFLVLALARAGVGLGEAGGSPPSYSIVSDYFPEEKRGMAVAVLTSAIPVGVMFGSLIGATIAGIYGWRYAFIALGLVGLVVAPLLFLTVKEPPRGQYDKAPAPQATAGNPFTNLGFFFRNKVLLMAAAASSLTTTVGYALLAWGPAMLMREKGADFGDLALFYSFAIGGALFVGTFGTGVLVDRLGKKSLSYYAIVPGYAALIAAPFLAGFALAPGWPLALASLMLATAFATSYFTASMTIVQNEVQPHQRATASALLLFFTNLLGLGFGPLIVGAASDAYADTGHGLVYGILALVPLAVVAFAVQFPLIGVLRRRTRWGEQ